MARSYLVCATPRTGSTLLCGLLRSTGVAGAPESYFREPDQDRYADRWGVPRAADGTFSDSAYVRAAVRAGSTPNGVFGTRVMWGSMEPLVARLRGSGAETESAGAVLDRAFGGVVFVHLRRLDVVAQAVSWARAEQSGYWHPGDAVPHRPPRFDGALVDGLVRTIGAPEARWAEWFAAVGIVPHRISYEQLVADMAGVTVGVLAELGLRAPTGWVPRPPAERQADAVSREWTERYLAWRQSH